MRIFQKMAVESPAFLADPDLTGTVFRAFAQAMID
jgi:hypothetical protein